MTRLPRWIFIPLILVFIAYWTQELLISDEASVFDLPKTLEEERSTLIVYPVAGSSQMELFSISKTAAEQDRLYLLPASIDVSIPVRYYALQDSGYQLQVFGRYYKGSGIPAAYLQQKPKPPRLRVFQYDSVALIKP
ncbi:MAG: hypothetical protein MUF62_07725 [Chitinophagaceae bacterium]|jgi:hypothetical protein|nr:hypothetical protein [Chitinophagaceae bacterium]